MSVAAEKSALILVREPARGRQIKQALATEGVMVIAEAGDAGVALPLIEEQEPALLVVELDATGGDASIVARNERVLELVRIARDRLPGLKVIAVMDSVDADLVAFAAQGIDAYVLGPER